MPDGQARIISIEHWYWYCIEFLDDEYGMDIDYILEKMVNLFGTDDDFDELLPDHIRLSVSALISKIIAEEDGLANVEWYRLDNTQ